MRRRLLLSALALLPTAIVLARQDKKKLLSADIKAMQNDWHSLLAEGAEVATTTTPLKHDKDYWRKQLPRASYNILFKEDTERPFSSALNDEKRDGVFACAACRLPLFTSAMKYDSGTGWPSFFTTIPGHIGKKTDYKLIWPRTEYHCAKCGGHQGHVFDDGPEPTQERWCNNGLALVFIPTSQS